MREILSTGRDGQTSHFFLLRLEVVEEALRPGKDLEMR